MGAGHPHENRHYQSGWEAGIHKIIIMKSKTTKKQLPSKG